MKNFSDPGPWGLDEEIRILGTDLWSNGHAFIRDRTMRYEWYRIEQVGPGALFLLQQPGDSVKSMMLFYDPRIYHAPLIEVDSFGVVRHFDARYVDVIFTRYPESRCTLNWLISRLVFHKEKEFVASLGCLGLNEVAWLRAREVMAKRCAES
jgi:hypothetical protein